MPISIVSNLLSSFAWCIFHITTGRHCWSLFAPSPTQSLGMFEPLFPRFFPFFSLGSNLWCPLLHFWMLWTSAFHYSATASMKSGKIAKLVCLVSCA
jgi:hypothetical protein